MSWDKFAHGRKMILSAKDGNQKEINFGLRVLFRSGFDLENMLFLQHAICEIPYSCSLFWVKLFAVNNFTSPDMWKNKRTHLHKEAAMSGEGFSFASAYFFGKWRKIYIIPSSQNTKILPDSDPLRRCGFVIFNSRQCCFFVILNAFLRNSCSLACSPMMWLCHLECFPALRLCCIVCSPHSSTGIHFILHF